MHFYNLIKELSKTKKLKIFVDMDGVIASYNFGKPLDFKNKRPLTSNIKTLKKISTLNVDLFILSVCITNNQIEDKNNWLDNHAPFFDKDKRIILSKENIPNQASKELKLNYLKTIKDENIILIDDDNDVLKTIHENLPNVILYQDSELID